MMWGIGGKRVFPFFGDRRGIARVSPETRELSCLALPWLALACLGLAWLFLSCLVLSCLAATAATSATAAIAATAATVGFAAGITTLLCTYSVTLSHHCPIFGTASFASVFASHHQGEAPAAPPGRNRGEASMIVHVFNQFVSRSQKSQEM